MIDYESCDPAHPVDNMNKAFQVAEEKFGIIRLLDPEDVAKAPEEKSIMTYISYLYHQFPVTPPLKRKKVTIFATSHQHYIIIVCTVNLSYQIGIYSVEWSD